MSNLFNIGKGIIQPSPIKKEYLEAPMDKFFPLDNRIDPIFKGLYMINMYGDILNISTGEIRKAKNIKVTAGRRSQVVSFRRGKIKKNYYLHRLKGEMFLENDDPINKIQIDHIDRNPSNHDLSNLRWVTSKENLSNRRDTISKTKYFDKYDENGNFIERIFYKDKIFSKKERDIILTYIKKGKARKGFIYKKGDTAIDDYIKRFGKPLDKNWVDSPRFQGRVRCNTNGMLEIDGEITIGSKDTAGHRHVTIDGERYWIHRICQEAKTGKLLSKEVIIDHINTIPDDNRFDNLRECTQQENMSNPNTILKFSKQVIRINPRDFNDRKEYNSVSEAAVENGICSRSDVTNICNGKFNTRAGWIFAWKGEEDSRITKFLEDTANKSWMGKWNDKEVCEKEAKKYKNKKEFGRLSPGAYKAAKRNNWLDEFFKNRTKL